MDGGDCRKMRQSPPGFWGMLGVGLILGHLVEGWQIFC